MKISEMSLGQKISSRLYLADASIRKTKGTPPKDFLAATFSDGNDILDGKIWSYDANKGVPELRKVYKVIGTIGEYLGKKQITISTLTVDEDQSLADFSCMYHDDPEKLWEMLTTSIGSIEDDKLHDIVSYLYTKYKTEILWSSSAKAVHHVGSGGNAAHTIEVYNYAVALASYAKALHPSISIDLVKAGALLHDIGKIFTYEINGPVVDVTLNGQLFDHTVIGMQLMGEVAQNFDMSYNKHIALLTHIIASHHGQLEYGSPVTPRFAEAYIVNYADMVSASMDTLFTANTKAEAEGREYTDKIFTLNNREHILQDTVAKLLV